VIPSSLFEVEKFDVIGVLPRLKAGLVANGHRVDRSLDLSLEETSAPTARFESFMVLVSAVSFLNPLMGVFDVAAAFLNSRLARPHFMRLNADAASILVENHPHSAKFLRADGSMIVRVEGGLYGLPESGKLWFDTLSKFFFELGYHQCPSDPCIFTKIHKGEKIAISTHVDDGFYFATFQSLVTELVFSKISHTQGNVVSYLGLRIEKDEDGTIHVSQPGYIDSILGDFPPTSSPAITPATDNILKVSASKDPVDQKLYLSKVMKLMYLATKSRPDILTSVSFLASRSAAPTSFDILNVDRVYSYLSDTRSHRLLRSIKQKSQSTSATHAEILTMSEAVTYSHWQR
jgi:hypothetical protein